MKKHLLLFSFIGLSLFIKAQNLVPNPSFENKVQCSGAVDNISDATGWYSARNTPDYFNPCANSINSGLVGVPTNFAGYQLPYDGAAYSGIYTFFLNPDYREVIGIQLLSPLVNGIKYYMSAFVSRGDTNAMGYTIDCATNNLGFKFSTVKYDAYTFTPVAIDNNSHIHSQSIITDKTAWIRIAGSFIADSAYSYLNIGNFYTDINTDTLECSGGGYYYVDMVAVSTDSLEGYNITGIRNISPEKMEIFPNPINNILNIKNLSKNIQYAIKNIAGQIITEGSLSKDYSQIDVSNIPSGVYFFITDKKKYSKILITH